MFNKHLSRILILLLIVQVAIGVFAFPVNQAKAASRTYYVDSVAGSDSYDGLEQTHTTGSTGPWQTIAHINAMGCGSGAGQLNAGDSVLLKTGDTFREQLTVPCSGSAGSQITFGSYGSGATPIIDGSNVFTGWTPTSTVIYNWTSETSGFNRNDSNGYSYTITNGASTIASGSVSQANIKLS